MTDLQLAHLSFGGEGRDRNREHLIALRDARIATDHRGETASRTLPAGRATGRAWIAPLPRFASRLRIALAGGPALTDERSCCAA